MLVHAPADPGRRIDEEGPVAPAWDYPESKLRTEQLIRAQRGRIPRGAPAHRRGLRRPVPFDPPRAPDGPGVAPGLALDELHGDRPGPLARLEPLRFRLRSGSDGLERRRDRRRVVLLLAARRLAAGRFPGPLDRRSGGDLAPVRSAPSLGEEPGGLRDGHAGRRPGHRALDPGADDAGGRPPQGHDAARSRDPSRLDLQPLFVGPAGALDRAGLGRLVRLPLSGRRAARLHRRGLRALLRSGDDAGPPVGGLPCLAHLRRRPRSRGLHVRDAHGIHGRQEPLAHHALDGHVSSGSSSSPSASRTSCSSCCSLWWSAIGARSVSLPRR